MANRLLQPLKTPFGVLANRIVMAPLTRCRATPGTFAPNDLMAEMYSLRADAGLLITEATVISEEARGFPNTPGVYSEEQTAGWAKVVAAVKAKGSARFFCQLWHQGRTANKALSGVQPVGPSAVPFSNFGQAIPAEATRELTLDDIRRVLGDYRKAAENAKKAGFDGVELHGANGYLPDQFLHDGSNKRTDAYGGSIANRTRFLLEALDECIAVFGAANVGLRLSPPGHFGDVHDSDPKTLFTHVVAEVAKKDIGYLHLVEPRDWGFGAATGVDVELTGKYFRTVYPAPRVLLSASGHDLASGEAYLEEGSVDAVVYGRSFIANPDLVTRFKLGAPLNAYDRATFYGAPEGKPISTGYVDADMYPTLEQAKAKAQQ